MTRYLADFIHEMVGYHASLPAPKNTAPGQRQKPFFTRYRKFINNLAGTIAGPSIGREFFRRFAYREV
jgi:hypothetical protein